MNYDILIAIYVYHISATPKRRLDLQWSTLAMFFQSKIWKYMNKNEIIWIKMKNMNKNEKMEKHKIKLEKENGTIFIKKTKTKKSKNLKISQKISKYLKISLMLFFKRGFVRLGSVLHIFLDHRKSQKNSKKLKKSQKNQNIPNKSQNLSNLLEKKTKKQATKKKKTNKLTQPYNNFAEASGRIAAQLPAVIIFSCVVKCWASRVKGFKTHLLVTWCIAMYCLITLGRSHCK